MEAASRPTSAPLPDLPVEDPTGASAAAIPVLKAAPAAAAPAQADPAATQTLLKMEFLLSDATATVPAVLEPPAGAEAPQALELADTLEVDRMLSNPPPPPPPVL